MDPDMTVTISFNNKPSDAMDTVVVGVYADNRFSPSAEDIDKKLNGLIHDYLQGQKAFYMKM